MYATLIKQLAETASRTEKELILSKILTNALLGDKDSVRFLQYFGIAYNPFQTLGIKQIPKSNSTATVDNWDLFDTLIDLLGGRQATGHAAQDAVEQTMNQMTQESWNGFAKLVLEKDMRCGVSVKTFNKVVGKSEYTIPEFECQLATDGAEVPSKLKGFARLEAKLDGVRVIGIASPDACTLYSRNGKEFSNFAEIEQELIGLCKERSRLAPASFKKGSEFLVFDGEIMSTSFQTLMKQARRKKDVDTKDCVYHIFDMLPYNDFFKKKCTIPQRDRIKHLGLILPENINNYHRIKKMPGIEVNLDTAEGHDIMNRFMADAVEGGFEGIMIKSMDAFYESKRSYNWIKKKPVITVDLPVIAVKEGTGKYKNKLGALILSGVTDDKLVEVDCGSGFSDQQRKEIWEAKDTMLGMIAEIAADAVTQNQDGGYSLRFPRFVRFRGFEPGEKL